MLATYSWFTEGFDTKDLTDASVLIDEPVLIVDRRRSACNGT